MATGPAGPRGRRQSPRVLRVATRGSALARWQASYVADRLRAAHCGQEVELVIVETTGDRRLDVPVWELGGQGVFVKEVQSAVLDGRADLAVHSAKDLPSATAPGLDLACVPVRADARDALVGGPAEAPNGLRGRPGPTTDGPPGPTDGPRGPGGLLARLPAGALVATGSVRRRAQLAWLRPDLTFVGLRGNIATRISHASDRRVVVVAAAALERLGLADRAAEVLEPEVLLPQVGQGALGIECRAGDESTAALLADLEDPASRRAVDAERGFLARLGSGCDLPVGAYATQAPDGTLSIEGMLASADGRVMLRARRTGCSGQPAAVGQELAEYLLDQGGGEALLADLCGLPAGAGGDP